MCLGNSLAVFGNHFEVEAGVASREKASGTPATLGKPACDLPRTCASLVSVRIGVFDAAVGSLGVESFGRDELCPSSLELGRAVVCETSRSVIDVIRYYPYSFLAGMQPASE